MKKILCMVLTALFLIAGCGDLAGLGGGTNTEIGGGNTGGGSDGDIKVERVDVDKTYIELDLQATKTAQISAFVFPSEAKQTLLYASENETIVSIDNNGYITAKAKCLVDIIVASKANPAIFKTVTIVVSDGADKPVVDKVLSIEVDTSDIPLI